MKKIIFTIAMLITAAGLFAQVAVNNNGSQPDASAMLDVQSTEKGMLVPRMTAAERDAISDPANGLLIFCTDDNNFYMNKGTTDVSDWQVMGSQWVNEGSNIYYITGNVGIGESNPTVQAHVNGVVAAKYGSQSSPAYQFGDANEQTGLASPEYRTIVFINNGSESARFEAEGRMGIGTNNPDDAALLELSSTTMGLLPPRMSGTQMNAISSPPPGLLVYNTTVNMLFCYNGESWKPTMNNDGMSCGTISYGGDSYNTVIIGTQCWMAENLNVGTRIDGLDEQEDNDIIEKYCYDDLESNCDTYGGLYQWDEMMQYTSGEKSQGICPTGWHLPDDGEWKTLEGYVDSEYGVGNGEWNNTLYRGFDVGLNLKSENAWTWTSGGYGDDLYDFAAEPGGIRVTGGIGITFTDIHLVGLFWTSSAFNTDDAWRRLLSWTSNQVSRLETDKEKGFSVRCIKN